jgi:hypothetical protein
MFGSEQTELNEVKNMLNKKADEHHRLLNYKGAFFIKQT